MGVGVFSFLALIVACCGVACMAFRCLVGRVLGVVLVMLVTRGRERPRVRGEAKR